MSAVHRAQEVPVILLERRELLDGFRAGKPDALLTVYRAYVKDVSRFLTRGFGFDSAGRRCHFRGFRGGYEIEAALQEIFRRAFEERARLSYDGMRPYRPFLLRIARNTVINDLKAKQPILFRYRVGRPVILDVSPGEDPDAASSPIRTPEEEVEAREVAGLVDVFKAGLDARALGVFRQRFEEGLSAENAATRLGLTRSQVRTTETKLRKRFLAHMQASGYLTRYSPGTPALQSTLTAIAMMAAAGGLS